MTKKRKFERPDYKEYINSYEWNRKRVKAFYVLGKRCEVCGSSKNIHVHHNNYGSLGNEKPRADLVILCKECHKELHLLVPTNSLGKRSVGYTKGHRCTLCMDSNQYKKTKYLSCGFSTQLGHSWKNPKPKAHRILHICERCLEAVGPRLLEENKICELSRALGMVYTLLLIDEQLVHQISIDYTGNEFIVNVENGKYILNWSDEKIVSITSLETKILRSIKATSIKKI